jgi:ATP-dependent Clp protease ATP-binding subunit ClpA
MRLKVTDDQLEEGIHRYCRDLTYLARQDRFDPITGRDQEILDSILILLQKGRKNVMYLAPAGVGKTALCIGLAQKIVKNQVPDYLKGARLLEIDLPSMAAGTSGPAEFQERFMPIVKGVAERYHMPDKYPKYILFMDEIHTIMPSCHGSAYAGLSEVMKPYLTVGDLHVIGATTREEYRIYFEVDEAADRRFQKIYLDVPTVDETHNIMEALKFGYEKHHKIRIPSDLTHLICRLTQEHMRKRNQPDKSIIVMDGACAMHVLEHGTGGELSLDAVLYFMSTEVNVHPTAFLDNREDQELREAAAERAKNGENTYPYERKEEDDTGDVSYLKMGDRKKRPTRKNVQTFNQSDEAPNKPDDD